MWEISELNESRRHQKQITRDFGPILDVQASLSAFARLEDIPVDYWIAHRLLWHAEGSGHRDADGRPAAFIEWTDQLVNHRKS